MKRLFITMMLLLGITSMACGAGFTDKTEETTPVGADMLIMEQADSSATNYVTFANVVANYLDAIYEGVLTNSAGLLAALSDETGTGLAVFGTAPTFSSTIDIGTSATTLGVINMYQNASAFKFSIYGGNNTQDHGWRTPVAYPVSAGSVLAVAIDGTMTYAAPTGTGSAVFSASPTLTGTVGAAAITATGLVTAGSLSSGAGGFTVDSAGDMISKDFAPTGAVDMTASTSVSLGTLVFANTATDPSAIGELRYDNTITGFTDGAFAYFNAGSAIKQIVDMTTATASACTDDQVVAYDAVTFLWYCKDDAGAAGGDSVSINGVAVVDPDFVSTGDIAFTDTTNIITANIGASVVDNAAMADNSIDSAEIVAGAVDASHISSIVESIAWNAGGTSSDGTNCATPAEVTINTTGPKIYTTICTNNDASAIYGSVVMPDSWDGGTVTMESSYIQTAADTGVLNGDIAMICTGAGVTVSATWGTEIAIDDAAVIGSNAEDKTTSAAVTPVGTCAGGDTLYWQYTMDAAGTTTAVATLHFTGWKIEYVSTVGD